MILVTGATGTIGSQVVRLLGQRALPFRAMSRDPGDLPNAVRADFDDPASLAKALTGVDTVFLVTAAPSVAHDLALLDAARAAGVGKIVKLSAIGSGEAFGGAVVGSWHHAAEEAIEASGLAWTMLRPPSFAANFLWYRDLIDAGEPIPNLLGDARQAVVDPRDVAAVAVAALTDSTHDGRRYDVTGPAALTFADQAAILGRVLGRPVRTTDLAIDAAVDLLRGMGMTPEVAAATAVGIGWARSGAADVVTGHVARILGRPAGTFEQWTTDHRTAFGSMP
jgi:uncharacterized protein YbjT (DUF2867 family)